ncbi:MAG: efflux RND transporter periplasmic adaptor subunit [Phycisphaeraceae bacterium]|nr:MAG: efflux RND transporter periplasmic adaptor subunit [Phycisphaeraceae bacterium]
MKAFLLTLAALALLAGGIIGGVVLERSGRLGGPAQTGDMASPDAGATQSGSTLSVRVVAIKAGTMTTPIEMLGSVLYLPGSARSASLAEEVEVIETLATPGVRVSANDPVLRVKPSRAAEGRLRSAQASVESARAVLEEARSRVESRVGTKQEVIQAEQSLASAEVSLQILRDSLPPEDGLIRAPSTGVLLAGVATPGSVVAPSASLFTIADAGEVAVRFGAPLDAAGSLAANQNVTVESLLDPSRPNLSSSISRFESEIDATSRTRPAWTAALPGDAWPVGEPVRVTALLQSPRGFLIPRTALALGDTGPLVFVVRDGTAHIATVTLLAGDADRVCVQSETLAEGDRVAVNVVHELEDGATVREEPNP